MVGRSRLGPWCSESRRSFRAVETSSPPTPSAAVMAAASRVAWSSGFPRTSAIRPADSRSCNAPSASMIARRIVVSCSAPNWRPAAPLTPGPRPLAAPRRPPGGSPGESRRGPHGGSPVRLRCRPTTPSWPAGVPRPGGRPTTRPSRPGGACGRPGQQAQAPLTSGSSIGASSPPNPPGLYPGLLVRLPEGHPIPCGREAWGAPARRPRRATPRVGPPDPVQTAVKAAYRAKRPARRGPGSGPGPRPDHRCRPGRSPPGSGRPLHVPKAGHAGSRPPPGPDGCRVWPDRLAATLASGSRIGRGCKDRPGLRTPPSMASSAQRACQRAWATASASRQRLDQGPDGLSPPLGHPPRATSRTARAGWARPRISPRPPPSRDGPCAGSGTKAAWGRHGCGPCRSASAGDRRASPPCRPRAASRRCQAQAVRHHGDPDRAEVAGGADQRPPLRRAARNVAPSRPMVTRMTCRWPKSARKRLPRYSAGARLGVGERTGGRARAVVGHHPKRVGPPRDEIVRVAVKAAFHHVREAAHPFDARRCCRR